MTSPSDPSEDEKLHVAVYETAGYIGIPINGVLHSVRARAYVDTGGRDIKEIPRAEYEQLEKTLEAALRSLQRFRSVGPDLNELAKMLGEVIAEEYANLVELVLLEPPPCGAWTAEKYKKRGGGA